MRDKNKVKQELADAERKHRALVRELQNIEAEEMGDNGDRIYQIPVQFTVSADMVVYAPDLKRAIDRLEDMTTPVGDYVDGSWEVNPFDESEETLLQGFVSLRG